MPPIVVLIIVGILLAFIGYLSLQLYISQRIVKAFQRAALVVPAAPESGSGFRSGLVALGLIMLTGLLFTLFIR